MFKFYKTVTSIYESSLWHNYSTIWVIRTYIAAQSLKHETSNQPSNQAVYCSSQTLYEIKVNNIVAINFREPELKSQMAPPWWSRQLKIPNLLKTPCLHKIYC